MIAIVDYGLGNLRSVAGAAEKLEFPCSIVSDASSILSADKLILPGVGAFADGMKNLRERNLIGPLEEAVLGKKIPILGICLGFQLLARESFEFGHHAGLGWIDASVKRLEPAGEKGGANLRVPHVGWNDLIQVSPSPLFKDIPAEALFYYVHSFHVDCAESEAAHVVGRCDYGGPFTSVVHKGNIFGTQFHPEKSQSHGLALLKNFLEL